jgi:hypothetical protein
MPSYLGDLPANVNVQITPQAGGTVMPYLYNPRTGSISPMTQAEIAYWYVVDGSGTIVRLKTQQELAQSGQAPPVRRTATASSSGTGTPPASEAGSVPSPAPAASGASGFWGLPAGAVVGIGAGLVWYFFIRRRR